MTTPRTQTALKAGFRFHHLCGLGRRERIRRCPSVLFLLPARWIWNRYFRMCEIIRDNILGFIIGVASSWLVAARFYSRGKHDAKRLHLQSQVDTILHALARCDHTQRDRGRRGDDGLEPTSHWILCMVDVLGRSGFSQEATSLREVGNEMLAAIRDFDLESDADRKKRKEAWQMKVTALRRK